MALLSRSKIFWPCMVAEGEPKNRLPTEHMDNSSSELLADG